MSISELIRAKIVRIEDTANQYAETNSSEGNQRAVATAYKAGAYESTLDLLAMHIDSYGDEKLKEFLKSRWG